MSSYIFSDITAQKKVHGFSDDLLDDLLYLAVEIAREGREGRKVGTIFVVGDTKKVLSYSRPLILDPLYGHDEDKTRIDNRQARETIKELAQLDGAFVVSSSGAVVSAARYIDVSAQGLDVPLGLGSRHIAAASISKRTEALAVVVSESSVVRVFCNGELVAEIIPELWMLKKHGLIDLGDDSSKKVDQEVTVVTRASGRDRTSDKPKKTASAQRKDLDNQLTAFERTISAAIIPGDCSLWIKMAEESVAAMTEDFRANLEVHDKAMDALLKEHFELQAGIESLRQRNSELAGELQRLEIDLNEARTECERPDTSEEPLWLARAVQEALLRWVQSVRSLESELVAYVLESTHRDIGVGD